MARSSRRRGHYIRLGCEALESRRVLALSVSCVVAPGQTLVPGGQMQVDIGVTGTFAEYNNFTDGVAVNVEWDLSGKGDFGAQNPDLPQNNYLWSGGFDWDFARPAQWSLDLTLPVAQSP
jgi:hypothetical protein